MTPAIGIAAALVSALTQAIAHTLLAGGRDKLVIRGVIAVSSMAAIAPFAFLVPVPAGELWGWLLASGCLHAIYQLTLIRAYNNEDFSVAYPLARGVVPILTTALGILFLGDKMTAGAIIGVVTVTFGLVYISSTKRPAWSGLLAALLAGLLTTAYTLLDAKAVRLSPQLWTFVVWFFIFDGVIMAVITLALRRSNITGLITQELKPGLWAGLASLVSYSTALIALRILPTGSAAALRETSVVFAVLLAGLFLKEQIADRRMVGAAIVAIGGMAILLQSGSG